MMNFITIVLGVAGGIILASVVMFGLMLQPAVIKWYSKQSMKMVDSMFQINGEETKGL